MSAWDEYSVEDLAARTPHALSTGPFGSSISSKFFQAEGIPVIRGGNLSQDVGTRLVDTDLVFVSKEKASEFSRSIVRHGDLVFTCWGTIDQVGLIDDSAQYPEYVISNKQMKLSPDAARFDSYFLYYLFKSPDVRERIRSIAIGSSVPGFNLGQLRRMRIRAPGVGAQRAIGDILCALDRKIRLNRTINRDLAALATALFNSWFVDFDPVIAKRDGRRPIGVPAEVIDLLSCHFEDSELGPIPQGWRIVPLDSVADFLNGLALQRYPARDTDELPVIKIAELRAETSVDADRCGGVPPEYIINDGDVVFSWSGSLLVDVWCGGKGALNQHLFKVTSSKVPKWFYLAWLNEHLPEFQAIAADKATTMGHIRRFHLTEAKVLLPSEPLMKAMTSVQQPLLDQIIHNRLESRTLAELRDTLLGPLLSGELTIKSAENVVGAAL